MESLFYGEADNAFFNFTECDSCRTVNEAMYPQDQIDVTDLKLKIPPKVPGELRIIAMDVAVMGGNKNDNTCYTFVRLLPARQQYIREVSYIETMNGGHVQDQAIRLRQLYDDLGGDYVIIDCLGVGFGVYEMLVRDIVDDERGVRYHPWTCFNDPKMAERCMEPDAPAVIYSMKANAQINNDIAVSLRDCMRRNKIKFLVNETEAEASLKRNKKYRDLSVEEQTMLKAPFMQTTLTINEMINLTYDTSLNKIRVHERAGARKDRYSSLAYANYLANELERALVNPDADITEDALLNLVSEIQF